MHLDKLSWLIFRRLVYLHINAVTFRITCDCSLLIAIISTRELFLFRELQKPKYQGTEEAWNARVTVATARDLRATALIITTILDDYFMK